MLLNCLFSALPTPPTPFPYSQLACYIHKVLDEYLLKVCLFLPSFIHSLNFLSLPVWRVYNFSPCNSGIGAALGIQPGITALLVDKPQWAFAEGQGLASTPPPLDIHVLSSVRSSDRMNRPVCSSRYTGIGTLPWGTGKTKF